MDATLARTVVASPAETRAADAMPARATVSERLRSVRPEVADLIDRCRMTILAPSNDRGLPRALRLALVTRVAARCGATDVARGYRAALEALPFLPIADGAAPETLATPQLAALTRHADLLTQAPTDLGAGDLAALEAVGLSAGAIVALTQIVAFANFEARVAVGLDALGRGA